VSTLAVATMVTRSVLTLALLSEATRITVAPAGPPAQVDKCAAAAPAVAALVARVSVGTRVPIQATAELAATSVQEVTSARTALAYRLATHVRTVTSTRSISDGSLGQSPYISVAAMAKAAGLMVHVARNALQDRIFVTTSSAQLAVWVAALTHQVTTTIAADAVTWG
jgi:hypothetical protein